MNDWIISEELMAIKNINTCKCCNKTIYLQTNNVDAFMAGLCNECRIRYDELIEEMLNDDL